MDSIRSPGIDHPIENDHLIEQLPDRRKSSITSSEENNVSYEDIDGSIAHSTPLSNVFEEMTDTNQTKMDADLHTVLQRLAFLESQVESNDEVIHEMERSIKSKAPLSELDESVNEVDFLKRKISNLEDKVMNLETANYTLEEKIEEKNKLIEARTMVISVLTKDVEAKREATNAMFEKTQQEIQQMHENFMAFKENMAIENKKLLDQLENSRQRYRKLDGKLRDSEKERGTLLQMNKDLNFQIESIMVLNNELKMKLVELSENIDSPKEKIKELSSELDSVKQEFKKTVINLELELAHYKSEYEKMKKSFQENQSILEKEVSTLKKENNSLVSKISNFEQEISALEEEKKEKEHKLLALVEEKEKLILNMEKTIQDFLLEREALRGKLTEAESNLTSMKSSWEIVNAEVIELRSALDVLKRDENEEAACSLNNEINLLQDLLCQSKNEVKEEKNKVEVLSASIDKLEAQIQDSELLLKEEKLNSINLKKELDYLKKEVQEKEIALVQERANLSELQANFSDLSTELMNLKQQYNLSKDQNCDMQKKLDAAEESKSHLKCVVSSVVEEILFLMDKTSDVNESIEVENQHLILREKFSEFSDLYKSIMMSLREKEDLIKQIEGEMKSLKDNSEDSVSLRQNCQSLETQLIRQNEVINELNANIFNKNEEINYLQKVFEETAERMDFYSKENEIKECSIRNLRDEVEKLLRNFYKREQMVSQNSNESLPSEIETLRIQLNYINEVALKEMHENFESKIEETGNLQLMCNDLTQKINQLSLEIVEKDKTIGNLQEEVRSLLDSKGREAAGVENLEASVNHLQLSINERESQIEKEMENLISLKEENENLKRRIEELQCLEGELTTLRRKLELTEAETADITESYNQLSVQHNELCVKFDDMSNYVSYLIKKYGSEVQNAEEAQASNMDDELQSLREYLRRSEELVLEKESMIEKLQFDYQQLECELTGTKETLQSKNALCDKLQTENDELRHEHSRLTNFESQCLALAKQVEELETFKRDKVFETAQATQNLSQNNQELVKELDHFKTLFENSSKEVSELQKNLEALKNYYEEKLSESINMSEIQVLKLEKLIEEKDSLIIALNNELEIKKDEISRKSAQSLETYYKPVDTHSGLLENEDFNGLLMITQEYLRVNSQLMILKDLLEDLIDTEIGSISDSDLKKLLENLECDLQNSESELKTYENKLRKFSSSDFNKSSILVMKSYVDQITRQISVCGEVLKDWVLVKTPPKKYTFSIETQTEYDSFDVQSKTVSHLGSENFDEWNWDIEHSDADNRLESGILSTELPVEPNKVLPEDVNESYPLRDELKTSLISDSAVSMIPESSLVESNIVPNLDRLNLNVNVADKVPYLPESETYSNEFGMSVASKTISSDQNSQFIGPEAGESLNQLSISMPLTTNHGNLFSAIGNGLHSNEPEHSHEHGHESDHHPHENHKHDHEYSHQHHEQIHNHEYNHQHHEQDHNHIHQHSHRHNVNTLPPESPDHALSSDDSNEVNYLQHNQLIVVNKAQVEEMQVSIEDLKIKLDSVLYKLHEKDVRCDELTRELIELLKERDILQLKLSSAYRLIANQENEKPGVEGTSNSMRNKELISKINELDSLNGWQDPMVNSVFEQKNIQAFYSEQPSPVKLKNQPDNSDNPDSEGAIYSLYNWITGSR